MPAQAERPKQKKAVQAKPAPASKAAPADAKARQQPAEDTRTDQGTAAGLANYQATLGAWLGSELYKAVAPQLTLDKLAGYAEQGLAAALQGSVGLLDKVPGEVDEGALDSFGKALADQYGHLAADWVKGDGKGVATALADWVDAHPALVVTVALLAAAGAVLANADIPELNQKLHLASGLDAKVSARLGKLRAIALEKIQAELSYTSGPLVAAVKLTHEDGEDKGSAEVSYGQDDRKVNADISFTDQGIEAYGVGGIYDLGPATLGGKAGSKTGDKPTIEASIRTKSGDLVQTRSVLYDTADGVLRFTDARKLLLDSGTFQLQTSTTSDGESSTRASYEGGLGAKGLTGKLAIEQVLNQAGKSSAYQLDTREKAELGLNFTRDQLEAELNATLTTSPEGSDTGSVSGKVSSKYGGGYEAGGDFKLDLGNKESWEVGAFYGFRDPQEFRSWLAKYRYKSADDSHDVQLLLQDRIGDVYLRLQQQAVFRPGGQTDYTAHGQGAMFVDKDLAVIGGMSYEHKGGKDNYIPEVGLQVKGVPLTIGYDTGNKGVRIGLTIPF